MQLAPDRLEYGRFELKADAAIQGLASDLFLWLVNRQPPDDDAELQLFGDRQSIDAWRSIRF